MQHLDETELQQLSRFFARRFSGPAARQPLATAAGLNFEESGDDRTAWLSLLHAAQGRGRMDALATAIVSTAHDDPNLREVCTLLGGSPRRRLAPLAPLAFVGAGACAAVLAVTFLGGPENTTTSTAPPELALSGLVSTSTAPQSLPTALPAPTPSSSARATVEPPPPPTVAAIVAPPEQTPPPAPATVGYREGCTAPMGELVGYFYAGAEPLGWSGQTITMPESANVRADYPDFRNGHNARAPVQCVIQRGQRLRLSADPIAVPGDRYWIPVYGGDLR